MASPLRSTPLASAALTDPLPHVIKKEVKVDIDVKVPVVSNWWPAVSNLARMLAVTVFDGAVAAAAGAGFVTAAGFAAGASVSVPALGVAAGAGSIIGAIPVIAFVATKALVDLALSYSTKLADSPKWKSAISCLLASAAFVGTSAALIAGLGLSIVPALIVIGAAAAITAVAFAAFKLHDHAKASMKEYNQEVVIAKRGYETV